MSQDTDFFNGSTLRRFFPEVDLGDGQTDTGNPLGTLMRAILIKAIEDFQKGGQLRRDAMRYMFESLSEKEDHVFSFASICETLQLDPQSVRTRIVSLTKPVRFRRRVAACDAE